jgi:hypothetical protein
MSRFAAVKNLLAGPLANAKAVRCPLFPVSSSVSPILSFSTQKTFMKRNLPLLGASQ